MNYLSSLAMAMLVTLSNAQDDRGEETIPGLGARKQEVLGQGADSLDLAIAMLETTTMTTDYDYGK